jgi:hypothetical protein
MQQRLVSGHKYRVGQSVHLLLGIFHPDKAIACTIVQLLPNEGEGFKYRVRGDYEAFDRVASEHDLSAIRTAS